MKLATILLCILMLFGCAAEQDMPEATSQGDLIIEAVIFSEPYGKVIGTALIPQRLAFEYKSIAFYDGETPPNGIDFNIIPVPLKEGGHIELLCIK